MNEPRIIQPRNGRGMSPDLSHLRRPDRPAAPPMPQGIVQQLLKGIRPELDGLKQFLPMAGQGMILGIPLTDLSRDELMAVASMLCMREAQRAAPAPDESV